MHGISLHGHWTCLALRAIADCWAVLMRTAARSGLCATAQPRKFVETEKNVLFFFSDKDFTSCLNALFTGKAE